MTELGRDSWQLQLHMVVGFLEASHCRVTHGPQFVWGWHGGMGAFTGGLGPQSGSLECGAHLPREVVMGHQRVIGARSLPHSLPAFHRALWPHCVCPCPVPHRPTVMLSRLRVCRSSSVVGKQQDGAMESSQTKGNACPAHRVGGLPASVLGAAPAEQLSEARSPHSRITCELASWPGD